MSRNISGTYSLPAGNPVVTGTTIASTWANATLSDIATALTDSLDRSGRGPMLAQFKAFAGISSAPGLSWADELGSGLYRAGLKDFRFQVNAATVMKWTDTAITSSLPLVVVAPSGNTSGVDSTGSGSGPGLFGTGGSLGGYGVYGKGGAVSGGGVYCEGTGTGPALRVDAGDALFTGTAPVKTTSVKDTVTKANIVKAWGKVSSNGVGGVTLEDGFNVTSVAITAGNASITVTLGQDFTDAKYGIEVTSGNTDPFYAWVDAQASGTFRAFLAYDDATAVNFSNTELVFYFSCVGRQ